MAINKKLIHFKKKEDFDNEVANKNILDHSIVFIQDSKEISTHGTVYKTVNWSVLEPELYEWVDLGLPSGTLWADRNVGASKPEEYGLYFAWGETEGYTDDDVNNDVKQFSWSDYKWCNGTGDTLIKYNNSSDDGIVDNLSLLEPEDDAVYTSDNTYKMPTKTDLDELTANTTSTWETLNGVNGRRFTSNTNSNSIFVPAAGLCRDGSVLGVGDFGYLWSSSLNESSPRNGWRLDFDSFGINVDKTVRYNGFSIRPVKSNN